MAGSRLRTLIVCMLSLAIVGFTGCGGATTMNPAALEGAEWRLTVSSVSSLLGSIGITATFDGSTVSGFSGVNRYSATYVARDDGSMEVGDIDSTLMTGGAGVTRIEREYQELLASCAKYVTTGGTLTLTTDKGQTLLYVKLQPTASPAE